MKYIGTDNFKHSDKPRIGVLLTNLGTPDAAEKGALRRYLKQFLSDPRVVEIPRLVWWFILHGVILNIRPARSAQSYASIWTEEGSPLLLNTKAQAEALQAALSARCGERVVVDFAMRYGNPSIAQKLQSLWNRGARQLLVLPLYPQYSCSTTASTFDALSQDFRRRRWLPELHFISQYHDHPAYIAAVANSIREHWQQHERADKLIFSFHGEPQAYLDRGDPYHCQCLKTSRLVAEALGLEEHEYMTAFQSRFGRAAWLQPYLDASLKAMPEQGIKSVQIVCPGFSSDCLETLEEIAVENKGYFLGAGGERFEYIPCLNAQAGHIDALEQIVMEHLATWLAQAESDGRTQDRALKLGAEQ